MSDMSEKDFLSIWELQHPRPEDRKELLTWLQWREEALRLWEAEMEMRYQKKLTKLKQKQKQELLKAAIHEKSVAEAEQRRR